MLQSKFTSQTTTIYNFDKINKNIFIIRNVLFECSYFFIQLPNTILTCLGINSHFLISRSDFFYLPSLNSKFWVSFTDGINIVWKWIHCPGKQLVTALETKSPRWNRQSMPAPIPPPGLFRVYNLFSIYSPIFSQIFFCMPLFHRSNLLTSKICQTSSPTETSENACAYKTSHI